MVAEAVELQRRHEEHLFKEQRSRDRERTAHHKRIGNNNLGSLSSSGHKRDTLSDQRHKPKKESIVDVVEEEEEEEENSHFDVDGDIEAAEDDDDEADDGEREEIEICDDDDDNGAESQRRQLLSMDKQRGEEMEVLVDAVKLTKDKDNETVHESKMQVQEQLSQTTQYNEKRVKIEHKVEDR